MSSEIINEFSRTKPQSTSSALCPELRARPKDDRTVCVLHVLKVAKGLRLTHPSGTSSETVKQIKYGGLPEGGLHPRLGPGHVQREAAGVSPPGRVATSRGRAARSLAASPPRSLVPAQPLPPVGIRSLRGSFPPPAASPPGSGRRGDGGLQTPARAAPRAPPGSQRRGRLPAPGARASPGPRPRGRVEAGGAHRAPGRTLPGRADAPPPHAPPSRLSREAPAEPQALSAGGVAAPTAARAPASTDGPGGPARRPQPPHPSAHAGRPGPPRPSLPRRAPARYRWRARGAERPELRRQ
ncbi:basic proline-rich protein-like [Ovis aries]|uniref:basic proline-rich protein-like n=1 Tax=Ovis aries TaxID=9940 RepID=UPI00295273AC|nr:basic proline-rich protein-like [Ovis aries]